MKCLYYDAVVYNDPECVESGCNWQRRQKCLEEFYADDLQDIWDDYNLNMEVER